MVLFSRPKMVFGRAMHLHCFRQQLKLTHKWTIARGTATHDETVIVQLRDSSGLSGLGESAPSSRYHESVESVEQFIRRIDPARLSFADLSGSMAYLDTLAPGNSAAKCAINIALLDGAARAAGKPVYDLLGLGFREGVHYTSFSIGIDSPENIRKKTAEADAYPILKIKVGVCGDCENIAAVREVAPTKKLRVDANEGWTTKEEALARLEWLATDKNIEFCEQPMPASTPARDLAWLRERSPLPIMADESFITAADAEFCAQHFHAVNAKLVKTGGITGAFEALRTARKAGLKTMIGCMIETSILITAGAHLAELADHLDLDGNLLVREDPYAGATARSGLFSFREAPEPHGLRVKHRD